MLNRLTVSTLLKAVILSTALVVVIDFTIGAWSSWRRLQQANRIVAVSAASADVFKTMANIRADRSTTNRQLTSDIKVDPDIEKYIRGIRDELMPALARAIDLLPSIDIPQRDSIVADLTRFNKALLAQQAEFWTEVATAIAAAVQEQGAATQEITRSTQYAAQGTRNVSDNITGVKADADTAAGAAENVKHASETLETQSRQLGQEVSDFLGKIRAA